MTSSGNSDGLEVGMVVAWTLANNPSGNYLECNGQAVDSSKYPKLYALMHNVPDYRGVFLRGLGGNSAALGELQGDAIRNITGYFGLEALVTGTSGYHPVGGVFNVVSGINNHIGSDMIHSGSSQINFDASFVVPTANENRPINKAVRYFIKAK